MISMSLTGTGVLENILDGRSKMDDIAGGLEDAGRS